MLTCAFLELEFNKCYNLVLAKAAASSASMVVTPLTPVHFASVGGHHDAVRYLVEQIHLDPFSRNATDSTSLHYASQFGDVKLVSYLTDIFLGTSLLDFKHDLPIHIEENSIM